MAGHHLRLTAHMEILSILDRILLLKVAQHDKHPSNLAGLRIPRNSSRFISKILGQRFLHILSHIPQHNQINRVTRLLMFICLLVHPQLHKHLCFIHRQVALNLPASTTFRISQLVPGKIKLKLNLNLLKEAIQICCVPIVLEVPPTPLL